MPKTITVINIPEFGFSDIRRQLAVNPYLILPQIMAEHVMDRGQAKYAYVSQYPEIMGAGPISEEERINIAEALGQYLVQQQAYWREGNPVSIGGIYRIQKPWSAVYEFGGNRLAVTSKKSPSAGMSLWSLEIKVNGEQAEAIESDISTLLRKRSRADAALGVLGFEFRNYKRPYETCIRAALDRMSPFGMISIFPK